MNNNMAVLGRRNMSRISRAYDKQLFEERGIIVKCSNLNKQFEDGDLKVQVLFDVNFEVKTGERVAIVGTSGSGKSTLLHLLGGLDKPTSGNIFIAGYSMPQLNEADRGWIRNFNMGFVYQFHHLMPEFTALENVAMPLLIRGMKNSAAMQQAHDILSKVGLDHRSNHKPGEMSGGERQRAAIARALVTKPACLLADEPTGNLDRKSEQKIYDLLLEINQETNTSFVIVTHNDNLAKRMDKIYQLEDGKLTI